jgi:CD2 antigen cytoplasmic tail-binding protein 2
VCGSERCTALRREREPNDDRRVFGSTTAGRLHRTRVNPPILRRVGASRFTNTAVKLLAQYQLPMPTHGEPSGARPKRSADVFTRTHHLDSDGLSSKKPRFDPRNPSTLVPDAEENDPILDADEIGKTAGIKRNAVNIDGYDSDSSTENFDARADAKAKAGDGPSKDDDDDMFAASDKEEDAEGTRRGDKKKAPVRFLEDHEIEGQDLSSKSGGHVAADLQAEPGLVTEEVETSSESGDDEERDKIESDMDEELGAGSKKKHAPKLDAFNMKSEQEEGRFDEAGNFVRKAYDLDAAQDAWLDGLSKKDIKRAKEAHDKRENDRMERERAEDSIALSDCMSTMISHLEVGETPMEALVRHGKAVPKKKPKAYNKSKKSELMEVEEEATQTATADKAKEAIDAITENASRLSDRGIEDIYDQPREMIMRQYKRETGEDWKDPNPPQWEFHWLAAPEDQVNGPYDEETMRQWQVGGQFEAGAEYRRVGETEWSRLLDFD